MDNKTAKRLQAIPFSSIRKVFAKAGEMEMKGIDITHMEIGRPDFDTPDHIKKATIQALLDGKVHYTPNSGIFSLREAISEKLKKDNDLIVDPEKGIVATVGCKEAVLDTVLAYIDPGDEVILPDPSWLEYRYIINLAGGIPVPVPLKANEGFLLNPNDVRDRITDKTKMILLNSPHNPTGAVLPKSYLKEIAALAIERDLLVVSDEIYEKLVYDEAEHISIASLPGMFERTIVINGFSKAYAMDGWRLGYVAGDADLIQPILKVHQNTTASATSFVQDGGMVAYQADQKTVDDMVQAFDQRRKLVVSRLQKMPGVDCIMPKGAFYVFPSFKSLKISSITLAEKLLDEAHIACVPGDAFGSGGEGFIRMAYSTSYEQLERAMDRLEIFLEKTVAMKN